MKKAPPSGSVVPKPKRLQIAQADLPTFGIAKCLIIPQALWDYHGGRNAVPLRLATSLNISPQSSNWRYLTGASIAYGLTDGGAYADEIKLTDLGRRVVAPTSVGDDQAALRECVLRPRIVGDFLRRLDQRKLPPEAIGQNILIELGVPKDRAAATFELIKENAREVGFLVESKGNTYIDLGSQGFTAPPSGAIASDSGSEEPEVDQATQEVTSILGGSGGAVMSVEAQAPTNNRVFISHGRNKAIVDQLKQILQYGKYEPIVAVEGETTATPLTQKVFDAMRSCFAGVINVHSEGEWQTLEGGTETKLNENVLIEIGAAMALYPGRYILLVQEGLKLPSNIAGLYQCRYNGADLGFEAAMKLLKAFNEFEKK